MIDLEGNVLAATFPESEEYRSSVVPFVDSPADSQVVQGHQFFKIYDELQVEYVLVAKGSSDDVYMIGKMAAFQIQNLLVAYKERFDKDNFIKNLLLDNLLLVDIYNRAKKLHIAANASVHCLEPRQVILLQQLMKRALSLSKSWLPKKVIRKWRKRQSRF